MRRDKGFDEYLNNLDSSDQQALNAYMDNLDLEDNQELDAYLDRIEEGGIGTVDAAYEPSHGYDRIDQSYAGTAGYAQVGQDYAGAAGYTRGGQDYAGAAGFAQDGQGYAGTAGYAQDGQGYVGEAGYAQDGQDYVGEGGYTQAGQGYVGEAGYAQGGQDYAGTQGLTSYIELEPEIESFQDYTTARMKPVSADVQSDNIGAQPGYSGTGADEDISNEPERFEDEPSGKKDSTISPDSPLNVSLLDESYEPPVIDTIRHKDDEIFGSSAYIDNSSKGRKHKKDKSPATAIAVILILLLVGGGAFATFYFTDGFTDFSFKKKEPVTEAVTEEATTTEATTEESTTEEQKGPYATVDYTLHKPHTTDSTIVYNSNPFSLRFSKEEWPIFRNDNNEQRDATQEELYPSITLEARDGSLNSTNPNPDNIPETQMLTSRYMVLVDLSDDSIVAKRDSDVVVNPASMTKILTVLTAADLIEDLDDTFIMTDEAVKYAYDHDGSAVGFLVGEKVTVRDLIYGTIVCSGADAAVGLAQYCCGSHEAFVEKMNEKAEELGISDTAHFTNVVGMYDENLHCTMEDMAVILSTAMQNELLKEVLNTRVYQTTPDPMILPEEVRKELGMTVNETDSDRDAGNQGENDSSTTETAEGEAKSTDSTTESSSPSTEEGTTEEIDPGVMLIATDGIQISNWFMRRIEDKDTGGEVLGAKTGFVNAAGFCCASYYRSNSGKEYVCVTGDTYSSWRCIYDHVGIYRSLAN